MSIADVNEYDLESISSNGASGGSQKGDECVEVPTLEGQKHLRFSFTGNLVTLLVRSVALEFGALSGTDNEPRWKGRCIGFIRIY